MVAEVAIGNWNGTFCKWFSESSFAGKGAFAGSTRWVSY